MFKKLFVKPDKNVKYKTAEAGGGVIKCPITLSYRRLRVRA